MAQISTATVVVALPWFVRSGSLHPDTVTGQTPAEHQRGVDTRPTMPAAFQRYTDGSEQPIHGGSMRRPVPVHAIVDSDQRMNDDAARHLSGRGTAVAALQRVSRKFVDTRPPVLADPSPPSPIVADTAP